VEHLSDACNILECLTLAGVTSIVKCLQVRPEPNQVLHLSGIYNKLEHLSPASGITMA
jgi:hypothetical protein